MVNNLDSNKLTKPQRWSGEISDVQPTNFRIAEAAISCLHKLNDVAETILNITYFDGMLAARINIDEVFLSQEVIRVCVSRSHGIAKGKQSISNFSTLSFLIQCLTSNK